MFSALRRRMHISPASAIACLALMFAMTGGAYAAGRYVITSTKQISPKVLKSLTGKAGPAGANGVQGATGGTGPQGPAGPQGPKGETGTTGAKGETGSTGPQGPEGREGTFGGETLPSGKTLTGEWAASGYGEAGFPNPGTGYVVGAVSFPLPLSEGFAFDSAKPTAHFITEEEGEKGEIPSGCTGNVHEPGAEPGNLCVFVSSEVNVYATSSTNIGSSVTTEAKQFTTGFTFISFTAGKGSAAIYGSWAVTAK